MNTISLELARKKSKWTEEDFIREILLDAGCSYLNWNLLDPNKPLTDLGSTILHLLTLNPYNYDLSISNDLIAYVLTHKNINVNVQDKYGRTALTNFIYCPGVWQSHLEYGISGLKLLLEKGSDPNILFTPQFVHLARCEKWPLIHHCYNAHNLFSVYPLPEEMINILEQYWDKDILDSERRKYNEVKDRHNT